MKTINIAKLLVNAKEGLMLWSPLFGPVKFLAVDTADSTIVVETERGTHEWFSACGEYKVAKSHMLYPDAECLIFPSKDRRTWEGWKAPIEHNFEAGDWIVYKDGGTFSCGSKKVQVQSIRKDRYILTPYANGSCSFIDSECRLWTSEDAEDGDVLVTTKVRGCPFIYRKTNHNNHLAYYYAGIDGDGDFCEGCIKRTSFHFGQVSEVIPATKEQRDLLFKKMKEAGYTWDEKKKELRKIIKPKFKVGDDIKTGNTIDTIAEIGYATRSYYCKSGRTISFENQDLWHLAPKSHYDISNFEPFDNVLVRDKNGDHWEADIFSRIRTRKDSSIEFKCIKYSWRQCIPFNEKTKHLLGTTDPCPEELINW